MSVFSAVLFSAALSATSASSSNASPPNYTFIISLSGAAIALLVMRMIFSRRARKKVESAAGDAQE